MTAELSADYSVNVAASQPRRRLISTWWSRRGNHRFKLTSGPMNHIPTPYGKHRPSGRFRTIPRSGFEHDKLPVHFTFLLRRRLNLNRTTRRRRSTRSSSHRVGDNPFIEVDRMTFMVQARRGEAAERTANNPPPPPAPAILNCATRATRGSTARMGDNGRPLGH